MPVALTLVDAVSEIRAGNLSPAELVDAYLNRIDSLDDDLGAYTTVLWERARARAREISDELARGVVRGPLAGIPYAVKDIVAVSGVPMTAGSKAIRDLVSAHDAAIVRKLDNAGAVLLGTTAMFELALASCEAEVDTDFTGPTNPWSTVRTAGGSSSGSAAAVTTELALFSIGTDTGGSVRIPASFCGVVGTKPTYGALPTRGIMPLSWTLDTPGCFSRTVLDSAAVMSALGVGRKPSPQLDPRSLSVAVFAPTSGVDRLDPRLAERLRRIGMVLEDVGCRVREVTVPMEDAWQTALSSIVAHEGYRSHARTVEAAPNLIGSYVRKRLEAGARITPDEYQAALVGLAECRRTLEVILTEVDSLILPSVPFVAPTIDDVHRYGGRAHAYFTRPINLTGFPAVSVPSYRADVGDGDVVPDLPLGLQIVGRHGAENLVHSVALLVEEAAGRRPRWTPEWRDIS